ncbi:RNA polymerase subunit sigma-70 [Sphingomonas spermidinifaciens]|uniref:RNA polymerase subunit sigma-70 n=1 Tax=Sphingomonas spermidinifaciens TaxID=1141889 RepID=A0A2A4B5R8_9SPHN|nr:sigma-70 family RNA polymerase sigma factor [Sphingomonas spermidinifaciens]PCD03407.1 RNA polymerase subunit sigma-70 [Sphingomonas spermidinifaciens]
MPPTGLEAVFLDHRDKLLRFLRARGAGEAAEDLVQDLWIKLGTRADGPIANPVAYLYRAADLLMIDRYRSRRQAERRDQLWEEDRHPLDGRAPSPEREVSARQETARAAAVLAAMGERKSAIFRRVRLDGVPQRRVAEEFGVSLSTVESDLRDVARALLKLKDEIR